MTDTDSPTPQPGEREALARVIADHDTLGLPASRREVETIACWHEYLKEADAILARFTVTPRPATDGPLPAREDALLDGEVHPTPATDGPSGDEGVWFRGHVEWIDTDPESGEQSANAYTVHGATAGQVNAALWQNADGREVTSLTIGPVPNPPPPAGTEALREAAYAWVDRILDPPSMWADDEDLALIKAVADLRAATAAHPGTDTRDDGEAE